MLNPDEEARRDILTAVQRRLRRTEPRQVKDSPVHRARAGDGAKGTLLRLGKNTKGNRQPVSRSPNGLTGEIISRRA